MLKNTQYLPWATTPLFAAHIPFSVILALVGFRKKLARQHRFVSCLLRPPLFAPPVIPPFTPVDLLSFLLVYSLLLLDPLLLSTHLCTENPQSASALH